MQPRSFLVFALALTGLVPFVAAAPTAAPLESNSTVPHHLQIRANKQDRPKNVTYIKYSKLKPMDELLPSNETLAGLYRKYNPYLYIKNDRIGSGCAVYPAIDQQARLSSGLDADASGSNKDRCRKPKKHGQVYVRSSEYKEYFVIMYSYFFPRDATWTEHVKDGAGHAFDWENCLIWLKLKKNGKYKIVAVSPSAHGGYKTYIASDLYYKKKTHPLLAYGQPTDNVRNRQLLRADEDEVGKKHVIVAWDEMTDQQRLAMNTPNAFDGTTSGVRDQDFCPFLDRNFADVEELLGKEA